MSTFIEVIGWLGALGLLAAYFLAARGIYPTDTWQSLTLNVVGAIFLTVVAFAHDVMPSVALNVIWIGIGLNALVKLYLAKKTASLEDDAHVLEVPLQHGN